MKDCRIALDENKTTTIEFMNTQRKIYELLLPLVSFTNAFEQGIVTIKSISKAFSFTREFVLESISYHASLKASIIEHEEYIIDFSDLLVEYADINGLNSFEISITDTNKKINSKSKQNRKILKKTRWDKLPSSF